MVFLVVGVFSRLWVTVLTSLFTSSSAPAEVARSSSLRRMAERRIGGDVPGLSEMLDQEVRGRLQSTEEAIMLVCRACNRQVSRLTEAAAHDCGRRHSDVLDARAHRQTHINLGMPFNEHPFGATSVAS